MEPADAHARLADANKADEDATREDATTEVGCGRVPGAARVVDIWCCRQASLEISRRLCVLPLSLSTQRYAGPL